MFHITCWSLSPSETEPERTPLVLLFIPTQHIIQSFRWACIYLLHKLRTTAKAYQEVQGRSFKSRLSRRRGRTRHETSAVELGPELRMGTTGRRGSLFTGWSMTSGFFFIPWKAGLHFKNYKAQLVWEMEYFHHVNKQGCHSHLEFWPSKCEFLSPARTMPAIRQPLNSLHKLLALHIVRKEPSMWKFISQNSDPT